MRNLLFWSLVLTIFLASIKSPSVSAQTSSIFAGYFSEPILYDKVEIFEAAPISWYKRFWLWVRRKSKPVQTVNKTYSQEVVSHRLENVYQNILHDFLHFLCFLRIRNQFRYPNCSIAGYKIIDADKYGHGGLVKVIDGGVQKSFVTLQFKSQPGCNMTFNLTIYGQCEFFHPREPVYVYDPTFDMHPIFIQNPGNSSPNAPNLSPLPPMPPIGINDTLHPANHSLPSSNTTHSGWWNLW